MSNVCASLPFDVPRSKTGTLQSHHTQPDSRLQAAQTKKPTIAWTTKTPPPPAVKHNGWSLRDSTLSTQSSSPGRGKAGLFNVMVKCLCSDKGEKKFPTIWSHKVPCCYCRIKNCVSSMLLKQPHASKHAVSYRVCPNFHDNQLLRRGIICTVKSNKNILTRKLWTVL